LTQSGRGRAALLKVIAVLLRNLAKWSIQLPGLASRHLPMKLCP
jgi:hypothetical protein